MTVWAFIALSVAAAVYRWRDRPARAQALTIAGGLAIMSTLHGIEATRMVWLLAFGITLAMAYAVDMVGDDAAPGTLLAASALTYVLIAVGFPSWWCQFAANAFGLAALGAVCGFGNGILADLRYRGNAGGSGTLGAFRRGRRGKGMGGGQTPNASISLDARKG